MRIIFSLLFLSAIYAGTPASGLWEELKAKRETLPGYHQEFEVASITKTAKGADRTQRRRITLDAAPQKWREKTDSGSFNRIRIFDGASLLEFDEGGDEYTRTKPRGLKEEPVPTAYRLNEPDWSKATEIERRPCAGGNRQCVVLEAPIKAWLKHGTANSQTKMLGGVTRVTLDLDNGLLYASRTVQTFETNRGGYRTDNAYALVRSSAGAAPEAALFTIPTEGELREVKELTPWDAPKIKKKLAGQPAPELALTDLEGKSISLEAFKGKTILIDFWATWCGPCRADAPAIDKLYKKYGEKDLEVIGISVGEDRAVVEKFLGEHPHSYRIALTSENEMPRPYQIHVFPTYIIIARDGTVISATQGNQGFGELKKLLKKAGLESE